MDGNAARNPLLWPRITEAEQELWEGKTQAEQFAIGYHSLLQGMGYADLVLATHARLLSYVCQLALGSLNGGINAPILSWLHGPPEAFGGDGES